ncbi:type VI secretion system-associated protein [Novosphingobium sp. PC22D]|uniref:type VI secretion system contractile sheath small subunit n=1 Tax=Novosphingobium sp. PC22D TaxID=1962403 RepID=UPI000BEFA481|nr:type VI secretion system contractile sheath small subunit [Novosphingobium sp. PC22D]PEQ14581.1 type VI secretion system-associated protein [Novosphingobium sp. PC22D]
MAKSGQRFIRENRAPRVHIEYEVETYGAKQTVELPFVMGVLSDLSGKSEVEKKALPDRDFMEIDMDNFDQRMERIAPRAAFMVDNALTGEGKLGVDLTFKSMKDFDPGEIARRVPAMVKLLEARQELNDLLSFVDGKAGAQDLLDRILKDPDLLKSLSAARRASEEDDQDSGSGEVEEG